MGKIVQVIQTGLLGIIATLLLYQSHQLNLLSREMPGGVPDRIAVQSDHDAPVYVRVVNDINQPIPIGPSFSYVGTATVENRIPVSVGQSFH